MRKILILVSLFLPCIAHAVVLTTLTGSLEVMNATDIRDGKEFPTHFLAIKIDAPLSALVDDYISTAPVGRRINAGDALQLAFSSESEYKKARPSAGKPVTVLCEDISVAMTAHHFTPLVCTVRGFSVTPNNLASKNTPAGAMQPNQRAAQGMDLVDGAIVCPSMDEANWLFGQINMARHARLSLSPELRRQAALINGFDYGDEPRPSDYRCQFVPAGTIMNVKMEMGAIPAVWGTMKDGRPFAGVTIPNMISR